MAECKDPYMILYEAYADFIVIVILLEYHCALLLSENECFLA